MSKRKFFIFTACLLAFAAHTSVFGQSSVTAVGYPRTQNERLAVGALQQILAAQKTYFSTAGNGTYGSLAELREAGLIDPTLASGIKFNFEFLVIKSDPTEMNPALFRAVAMPLKFGFGIQGYFINEQGTLFVISRDSEVQDREFKIKAQFIF